MTIVEAIERKFSTYLALRDRVAGSRLIAEPAVDLGLQNLARSLIALRPQASEEEWARFFLKKLLEAREIYYCLWFASYRGAKIVIYSVYLLVCQRFLFCYLQTCCWGVAKTIHSRLHQSSNAAARYPVEECYLLACEIALNPAKLLRRFDFDTSVPLQAYANAALQQAVRDRIARELKSKAIKFSRFGLLRNLSPSRLRSVLSEYGLQGDELEKYCLVVGIFKGIWEDLQQPTNGNGRHRYCLKSNAMTDEQLGQIAERYAYQADRLGWQDVAISTQAIRDILEICVRATQIGDESQQRSLSLEDLTQIPGAAEDGGLNPLEEVLERERKGELSQVREVVERAIEELEERARQGLLLSLGLQISQSDLASFLGVDKQYQVARQFQRHQRAMFRSLVRFYASMASERAAAPLPNATIEKEGLTAVKEYTTAYSRRFLAETLETVFVSSLDPSERQSLVDSLQANVDLTMDGGARTDVSLSARGAPLARSKLIRVFQLKIEGRLNLKFENFKSASEKIELFVDEWLQQSQASLISRGEQDVV